MNRKPIDDLLFKKCCERGDMTNGELCEFFGLSVTTLRKRAEALGIKKKVVHPEGCQEKKPRTPKRIVERKCLCGRMYETELGFNNKAINYLCPRCNKIARYIGNADEHYAQGIRI